MFLVNYQSLFDLSDLATITRPRGNHPRLSWSRFGGQIGG
jgi:hypothetical protein